LCPEEEAPDLRPADALPRALAAWDAWGAAHPDEAVDAVHLPGLRLELADAAEKLAGQELDVPEQHASRHQSELQVVLAVAVETDALELCTQAAAQSVEQSCAAPVVAQQLALPQQQAKAARSKPLEPLARKMPEQQVVLLDAPEEHSRAWIQPVSMQQEMLRPVAVLLEELQPEARRLQLAPTALPPELQPLSDD
jgi:hypothetical protein